MSEDIPSSLWEVAWVMFTGPDPGDLQSIKQCFKFNWFIHVAAYLLTGILSLIIVVVLVNLLIAMMSKTFEAVCADEVREVESELKTRGSSGFSRALDFRYIYIYMGLCPEIFFHKCIVGHTVRHTGFGCSKMPFWVIFGL